LSLHQFRDKSGAVRLFMAGVKRSLVALATLGVLMGGCAAGPSILQTVPESMPESMGGLPENAPAAPKDPYQYPAVHDMPPARSDTPMNNDQLLKAEQDLQGARDRQIDKAAKEQSEDASDFADPAPAAAAPSKPAKKKANAKKTRAPAAQAGAATNP
jgi:hypothetical protein